MKPKGYFTGLAIIAFAAPAAAQGVVMPQAVPPQAALEKQAVGGARMAVESRITAGAPYSAEAVNESVQVLADGNRIVRKTSSRIYRDNDGRTRREQLTSAGEIQAVSISDPVAGATFVLDPATKTAQRTGVIMATAPSGFSAATIAGGRGTFTAARTPEGGVTVAVSEAELARRREVEAQAARSAGGGSGAGSGGGRGRGAGSGGGAVVVAGEAHAGTVVYPAEGVAFARTPMPNGANVNREDLGSQIIEGIAATGTRTTTTIPAGSIGNEQPIVIVSEQWFSPELKVLVMTKHSDPRSGETTYRLTNIAQSEPARSLFEVPADYTLRDSAIRRQSPMEQ
jgi:hypothetical protein